MLSDWEIRRLISFCRIDYEETEEYARKLALGIVDDEVVYDLSGLEWYTQGIYKLIVDTKNDVVHLYVDLYYFACADIIETGIEEISLVFLSDTYYRMKNIMFIQYHVVSTELAKRNKCDKFQYVCICSGGETVDMISVWFETTIQGGKHAFYCKNSYCLNTECLKEFSDCVVHTDNLLTSVSTYKDLCDRKVELHVHNQYQLCFDAVTDKTIKEVNGVYNWLSMLRKRSEDKFRNALYNLIFVFFEPYKLTVTIEEVQYWFVKLVNNISWDYKSGSIEMKYYELDSAGDEMLREYGIYKYTRKYIELIDKVSKYYYVGGYDF